MIFRALISAMLLALMPLAALSQEAAAPAPTVSADEAVQSLLNVLQDEAARTALIQKLQADQAAAAPAAAPAEEPTLAQQVADNTANAAQDFLTELGRVWGELTRIWVLFDDIAGTGGLSPEAIALILTIVTTIAASAILGEVAGLWGRRHTPAPTAGFATRAKATGIFVLLRLIALGVAFGIGFVLATGVFSRTGVPSPAQVMYLNAFAVFGLVRVLLRAATSPDADNEPALSLLAPGAQTIIYRNIVTVAGIVIQGFLFLIPLTQAWLGFAAVRPLRTLIATVAAILAVLAVRRISRALELAKGDRPNASGSEAGTAVADGAQSTWRRVWPLLAYIYIGYSWFIAVTRPALIDTVVLRGTIYTVIAVFMLLIALRFIRGAGHIRLPLPEAALRLIPNLGSRMNRVAMIIAWIVSVFLILLAISVALSGWGFVSSSMLGNEQAQAFLWRVLSAVMIGLFAALLWAVVDGWIDYRLTNGIGGVAATNRTRTLLSLFRNAFSIAIIIFATMITLSQLGIDIAPLIAGAGVIGLAIGFGSQKLVQDVITGIFIQLENAINVGDVVMVGAVSGGVEKVSIRSVRLRSADGAVHIVPFSSVDTVSNMTRDFGVHVADIGVAYKENIPEVKAAMQEAFDRLMQDPTYADNIMTPIEVDGVMSLGDSSVVVRGRIKTLPGKHWMVGRAYTEMVKQVMDEKGIEIPFPQAQINLPENFGEMLRNAGHQDAEAAAAATVVASSGAATQPPKPKKK